MPAKIVNAVAWIHPGHHPPFKAYDVSFEPEPIAKIFGAGAKINGHTILVKGDDKQAVNQQAQAMIADAIANGPR